MQKNKKGYKFIFAIVGIGIILSLQGCSTLRDASWSEFRQAWKKIWGTS